MTEIVLALNGVEAGYGGGMVLQGFNLEVKKGSITCIVGPNGAGKSTVFRVISGLLKPNKGEVTLSGKNISGISPSDILRLGITQVPQTRALFPEMSVRENILMGGYSIRKDSKLLKQRIQMVEEIVPIVKERASDPAGFLSGGQRRMVEIARALVLDPSLILMDEPSLGLAPLIIDQIFTTIRKFVTTMNLTVVLVEQNAMGALAIADDGVVLNLGRVVALDSAENLLKDPAVRTAYLGY